MPPTIKALIHSKAKTWYAITPLVALDQATLVMNGKSDRGSGVPTEKMHTAEVSQIKNQQPERIIDAKGSKNTSMLH
jgi:hypothetical protein